MAEHDGGSTLHSLLLSSAPTEEHLSFDALARMRSLFLNPSTPDSDVFSLLETLHRSLRLSPCATTLSLLADISSRLALSPLPHALLPHAPPRRAAESLDFLASAGADPPLDGVVFASLCFGASASVRLWLLRNAERFGLKPCLKLPVFLGFTKDPYPCVRKVALDGLASLSDLGEIVDEEMIRGCYFRALELLIDMEDSVRLAAIRAVCAWGLVLSASNQDAKARCYDELFVELCSMARDMSVEVRVETFVALGKIQMVSEDILLQTLSKRVLDMVKEKRSFGHCSSDQFERAVSSAAGALLHGLEDEYHEVRKSACHCLSTLVFLSARFASEALEFLIHVMNDDSLNVRLEALETMRRMSACDCLNLQQKHMHMFLGPLAYKNASIRNAATKILKTVKLSFLELFKLTVDALLQNLARYPEDEVDTFSVLFHIGCNHGNFVVCIIDDLSQQIEPTHEGKLDFDDVRVAALIVLAISAPLLPENVCTTPTIIYSYAVTMLGRISNALSDVMDQNSLLSFFSRCSRFTRISAVEFKETKRKMVETSETRYPVIKSPSRFETSTRSNKLEAHDEVMKSMNAILAKVRDVWSLVQSGKIHEVLCILRSYKIELSRFGSAPTAYAGIVAFTLQYLRIIKLLSKVWKHFKPSKFLSGESGPLDLLLRKLDRNLQELKCRFVGFSKREELHFLELTLLICIIKLSKIDICCKNVTLKRIKKALPHMASLVREGSDELSDFVAEVSKSSSRDSYLFTGLLERFSLKRFELCGRLDHIKAELKVHENNFDNPIYFIPGLPIGISCRIILHNVLIESRLWLRMTMDDGSTQFMFLDSSLSEYYDRDGYREFSVIAPFYRTPKAFSFSVRLRIGMECPFEEIERRGHFGPKRELAYLCKEQEAFLAMNRKG